MAIVYIPFDSTSDQVKAVRALIDKALLTDINWSGETIDLDTDETCWIKTTSVSESPHDALYLLKKIQGVLSSD